MVTNNRLFDRTSLRLSATLLFVGQTLYILVTLLHADGDAIAYLMGLSGTYLAQGWLAKSTTGP
jgi:hypothetical protein